MDLLFRDREGPRGFERLLQQVQDMRLRLGTLNSAASCCPSNVARKCSIQSRSLSRKAIEANVVHFCLLCFNSKANSHLERSHNP